MNLFELFVKIGVDTGDAEQGIESVGKQTKTLGDKIKSGLTSAVKVTSAAVAAGSAVVAALTKSAVSAYADYEQLVDGVETLFKTSSDKVLEYAKGAYKTAGLSANDYMETVTAFSASLLQSLDNDTEAAADKADMAITDMSDNANKMGTDMTMIQNAYQGFAKQNYTMLDNLKLGYGGTKEEMERLLADAGKLSGIKYDISSYADIVDAIHVVQTEMGITGTTAEEAASTIQGSIASMKAAWKNLLTGIADENSDLAGLTDKFIESVDVAADNVLSRVEQGLDGIGTLIDKLVPKVINRLPALLKKSLPKLIESGGNIAKSILEGATRALPTLASAFVDAGTGQMTDTIPAIVKAGVELVGTAVAALPETLNGLLGAIPDMLGGIVTALVSAEAPTTVLGSKLRELAAGTENLKEAAANLTPELDYMNTMVNASGDTLSSLDDKVSAAGKSITDVLSTALAENGELVDADIEKIREYAAELDLLIQQENEFYARVMDVEIEKTKAEGISSTEDAKQAIRDLTAAYDMAIEAAEENYEAELNAAIAAKEAGASEAEYNAMVTAATETKTKAVEEANRKLAEGNEMILGLSKEMLNVNDDVYGKISERMAKYNEDSAKMLEENAEAWNDWNNGEMANVAADIAGYLGDITKEDMQGLSSLLQIVSQAVASGGEVDESTQAMISGILGAFDSLPEELKGDGKAMLEGLTEGLDDPDGLLKNASKQTCNDLLANMRNVLGIHSPSTVTAEMGKNMVLGLKKGIEDNWETVESYWLSKTQGLVSKANALLGIQSPSKVFAEIGGYMAAGLGVGWARGFDAVERDISGSIGRVAQADSVMAQHTTSMVGGIVNGISALSADNGGTYNINLVCDGEALARVTFNPMMDYADANGTPLTAY